MYHVTRNGVQQGQLSLDQINGMLAAGTLSGHDLAWQDGMTEWQPLSSIPAVQARGGPPPVPGGLPAASGAYAPPQAYVAPPAYVEGARTNSGMAVASLVLGILCLLLFFTHIFALLLGLLAVIFGHVSRSAINRSQGRLGGGGMALTGLITGYIGSLLAIIILIFAAFVVTQVLDKNTELGKAFNDAVEHQNQIIKEEREKEKEREKERNR
jgi:hypothetical protein